MECSGLHQYDLNFRTLTNTNTTLLQWYTKCALNLHISSECLSHQTTAKPKRSDPKLSIFKNPKRSISLVSLSIFTSHNSTCTLTPRAQVYHLSLRHFIKHVVCILEISIISITCLTTMKCFHFPKEDEDGGFVSRVSKVSWARSLSMASSSVDVRRSEYESEYSRDLSETAVFHELLCQRRGNDLRVFGFSELRSATRGFSRALMIGEGGFGCVYRGVVAVSKECPEDKMDVAVKQLNRSGFQGHKEWITEVNFLGVVKHPNLVKLVGYCAEDDERGMQRLLVYELMHNKSLEDHLLARVPPTLTWITRLKIAHDAARGLAYLHEEMDFQLIFRDFKTSNILLDEDFNAKLSDFGLARQGPSEGIGHVSTSVVGTAGYVAPEYVQTGRLTAKSDVWSFGVVLYELITGRRSVNRNLPRSEQRLLEWVKPYVSGYKKIHLIMDPRLEGQYCIKSAEKLVRLANRCLMKQPKSRPKMSEVVEILGQIINEILSPEPEVPKPVEEVEPVKEKEDDVVDAQMLKLASSFRRKVFDFKDLVGSRNRSSSGKLDWRNWAVVVRTW